MASVPVLIPTVTFNAASDEADRQIMFGQLSGSKANEYNISVIDSNDESIAGTVQGMVSVDTYSPGADRPETTAAAADLSTGCRKFRLFYTTINRAVFSVSGLATGSRVMITAVRGT